MKETIKCKGIKIMMYANIKDLQHDIRNNIGIPDYVCIMGVLYTMEEYDMDGKEISYVNKRTTNRIILHTKNRYSELGVSDANIELIENSGFYRNDVVLID